MQERIHLNCPDSVRFRGVLITVTKVRFPLQQDFSWSGDKAWLLKQSPVPSISLFVGCHMAIGTVYLCMSYIQIMWKPNGIMKACTYAGVFPLVMIFFDTGAILGGHVRAVFTLITFIFTICVALTVTSFKEIPLHLLESQKQVRGDLQKRDFFKN